MRSRSVFAFDFACHVRGDAEGPAVAHQACRIIALVGFHSLAAASGQAPEQFRGTVLSGRRPTRRDAPSPPRSDDAGSP